MKKKAEYFISVGEPWDFESPDGQNIIRGKILSIVSNKCLVFKANHHLKFGETMGNILILTPRYESNDFSDLESELIAVNGGIFLKEYHEYLNEKELRDCAKFEIIGSIRKHKNPI